MKLPIVLPLVLAWGAAHADPVLAGYQRGPAVDKIPALAKPPARTAGDPTITPTAADDTEHTWTLTFDSKVTALQPVTRTSSTADGGHAWLVTVAAVQLAASADDHPATPTRPTDEASRSFILSLPADVAVDLHVGQPLRGTVQWMGDGMWSSSMNAWIEDDQGVVFAFDPKGAKAPGYAPGAKTKLLPAESYEVIYGIAVTLDGKKQQVAGWQPTTVAGKPYLLYGCANRLKPGSPVNDYPARTTFAMVRRPAP
ncbi:MAG TPA: hypothetical protein VGC42_17475 [Kofleriaceae bacterium]